MVVSKSRFSVCGVFLLRVLRKSLLWSFFVSLRRFSYYYYARAFLAISSLVVSLSILVFYPVCQGIRMLSGLVVRVVYFSKI